MDIVTLRKKNHMKRADFAEYFGIPVRTLEKWEQGVSSPPSYVYRMMERILSLEQSFLMVCDGPSARQHDL